MAAAVLAEAVAVGSEKLYVGTGVMVAVGVVFAFWPPQAVSIRIINKPGRVKRSVCFNVSSSL